MYLAGVAGVPLAAILALLPFTELPDLTGFLVGVATGAVALVSFHLGRWHAQQPPARRTSAAHLARGETPDDQQD